MIRSATLFLALLVAATVGLGSRIARAEPSATGRTPLYVLSIWTNDADDQADGLAAAFRTRVGKSQAWSLAEAKQSFETLAIALKCPPTPNAACLERIGDQLHADHYVWGTIAKEKAGEVTADLRLWTRGKPQGEASESYADNMKDANGEALRAVAAKLFTKLTGESEGVDVTGASVSAEPAAPSELSRVEREPDRDTTPFPLRKVVGYSAIVAGVGLLAAGGVEALAWMSDKNASDADRASIPKSVTDVCASPTPNAAAADACQKSHDASTAATLGWIFTGAGAVVAGAGVWLVLTDRGSGHNSDATTVGSKLTIMPALGPRSGAIDLRVTF